MNDANNNPALVSQGVDELIAKLRQEGVDAGKAEAEKVLHKAQSHAKSIIDNANYEARKRLKEAQLEADALLQGGEEALKTAMRDMVLSLKTNLTDGFRADVMRLVEKELKQPDILKQIILELAGKLAASAGTANSKDIEFVLPEQAVGLNELREAPEKLAQSPLTEMVFGLTRDMLLEGVNFTSSTALKSGMQVKLKDQDLVLDFTEQSVAAMLLEHLQPRFRAILEGVVR